MYIVGKHIRDNKYMLIKLEATNKGWHQTCDHRALDCEYVSNESIPQLLEWFKCEFFNYRIFQNQEEAAMYQDEKMNAYTRAH
jgi:hypothetical protein